MNAEVLLVTDFAQKRKSYAKEVKVYTLQISQKLKLRLKALTYCIRDI